MRRTVEELWNRGDLAGFMAAFTEDAELQPQAGYPDGGAVIRGKQEITQFFEGILRPVELGTMQAVGQDVMCSFRWAGSPADTGFDWTFLYRFEGERIVRARYFTDSGQALRAAQDPAS
jgi:ketosteroid isomerase-like protein